MALEEPRTVIYHVSLNRHNMILGGDRELVLCTALVCVILIVLLQSLWSAFLGISLWIVAVGILKRMGKEDPIMRQVFIKYLNYKDHYPAQSGIDRVSLGTPKKW